jgi:1-acyl-sn-glycerol-3-phosphate acyltransferase
LHGLENLPRAADGRPAGGWICCGLPHRTWAEPFVLIFTLPARPRMVMLGEGPTIFGSAWRAFLVRRVGCVVPIWRGSGAGGFTAVRSAALEALAAGAVFAIFPEVGPPARPPTLRRLSPGVARVAQAAGASVVPVVFGGTHDLYLRRRIVVRVLPAIDPLPADADRDAVRAYMATLEQVAGAAATDAHSRAEVDPPLLRLARWLRGPFPRAD